MTTHSLNMHTNEQQSDGSFTTCFSSNSTTSLGSRLDRADSMKEMVPLDLAVNEAQSRGSLLDRIASLEERLLQFCLLIESKAATPSKGSGGIKQTFPYTNFLSESRKASSSLSRLRPSLKEDKVTSQVSVDKYRVKEQEEDLKSSNNGGYMGNRTKKCTSKRATLKAKRESPSSWLHFKLLGC